MLLFSTSFARLAADASGVVVSGPDSVLMRMFTSPRASLSRHSLVFVTSRVKQEFVSDVMRIAGDSDDYDSSDR